METVQELKDLKEVTTLRNVSGHAKSLHMLARKFVQNTRLVNYIDNALERGLLVLVPTSGPPWLRTGV